MVALKLQQFQYNLQKTFHRRLRCLVFPLLFGPSDAPPPPPPGLKGGGGCPPTLLNGAPPGDGVSNEARGAGNTQRRQTHAWHPQSEWQRHTPQLWGTPP